MILKHEDKENGACYWSATEFVVKRITMKFEDFEKSGYKINEPQRFDFGRDSGEYNEACRSVRGSTGWDFVGSEFIFSNNYNYSNLLTTDDRFVQLIAVLPKSKGKEYPVLVFNDWTWLMTDDGRTIETLVRDTVIKQLSN